MTHQLTILSCLVCVFGSPYAVAKNASDQAYKPAIAHIKTLPEPPAGFKWAVNPDFTDEFEGPKLNGEKWYDKSPYWTNGRPPATFKAYNVSVEDGCLRIKNSRLNPTEGNDGKPGTKYSLAGGAVASKSDQAWYGYYETCMKASPTPMSSTFWLKNLPKKIQYVNKSGKLITEYHRQELDMLPFLQGVNKARPHQSLYWRMENRATVREGDWKMMRYPDRPAELFNIVEDVGEQDNLAAEHPERVKTLYKQLFAWELTLERPLFQLRRQEEGWSSRRRDEFQEPPSATY